MYEAHFGFRANPFRIAPDPRFFFASAGHKRGLAYMRYGLHQGQGFVVVTGEPGTGKTMLVHTLLSELSDDEYSAATITSTNLRADDVLRAVAENFGIDQRAAHNKAELLTFIQRFLVSQHEAGKKSLLIVDEAQNLPPRSLEELRMLSNFQIGHEGLLQIILAGQPQLRKTLAAPSMEQLSQRILAGCHLKPISAVETRGYINHRLQRVGWRGTPGFSPEALSLIFQISRGIPRLINVLVDRLLLSVCLEEQVAVDEARVRAVLAELKEESTNAWIGEADVESLQADSSLAALPEDSDMFAPSPSRREERAAATAMAANAYEPLDLGLPDEEEVPSRPSPSQKPTTEVAQQRPVQAEKSRPKIMKAMASASGGQAAQLVQMSVPKEKEKEPQPKVKPKAQPAQKQPAARPQRRVARGTATPQKKPASSDSKVIELPISAKKRQEASESARQAPPQLDDMDIPELADSVDSGLAMEMPQQNVAQAAPILGGQPFGSAKRSFSIKIPQISATVKIAIGAVVLAIASGVITAYLLTGGNDVAPTPAPAAALPQALTPPPAANAVEPRKSLFNPRESVAVSAAPSSVPQGLSPPPVPDATQLDSAVPEWALADLVYTFILAYENGNLSLFNSLFTDDIVVAQNQGRAAVVALYQGIFAGSEMRSMSVNDLKWRWDGDVLIGEGYQESTVWQQAGSAAETKASAITLEVRKQGSRFQISRVQYD